MDSNQRVFAAAVPNYTNILAKALPHNNQLLQEEYLDRIELPGQTKLSKDLFGKINKPNKPELLQEESTAAKLVIHLREVCSDIENKITEQINKINVIDNTGTVYLSGEEDNVLPPNWTQKGVHCISTQKVREQIVKRAKLEMLYNEKFNQDTLIAPTLSENNECFKEINNLYDFISNGELETLFVQAQDCDVIRELLGPDHAAAHRYQNLILTKIQCQNLKTKRKILEITLAKLEFSAEQRLYEFHKKSADNLKARIDAIPKIHSKKLYCRNKHCQDCKHTTRPSLATYGLQKPGPRGRRLNDLIRQQTTSVPPRQRSLSPEQRSRSPPRWRRPYSPRERTRSPSMSNDRDSNRQYLSPERDHFYQHSHREHVRDSQQDYYQHQYDQRTHTYLSYSDHREPSYNDYGVSYTNRREDEEDRSVKRRRQ